MISCPCYEFSKLSATLRSEARNRAVMKLISTHIIERGAELNRDEANRLAEAQLMMRDSSKCGGHACGRIEMIEP